MYTFFQRASTIFTYALTTLGLAIGVMAFTTHMFPPKPDPPIHAQVKLNNVHRFYPYPRGGKSIDNAFLTLDISADLRGLFHCNTKQIFAYITANYVTPENERNELVIWDKIIDEVHKGKFELNESLAKYVMEDMTNRFRDREMQLVFHYDIIPWSGVLTRGSSPQHDVFRMPEKYTFGNKQ